MESKTSKTVGEEFSIAKDYVIANKDVISRDVKAICKNLNKITYGFGNNLIKLLYGQPNSGVIDYMHEIKLYYGKNRLTDREFVSLAKVVFPRIEFTKDNIERYGNFEHFFPDISNYEEIPCPF